MAATRYGWIYRSVDDGLTWTQVDRQELLDGVPLFTSSVGSERLRHPARESTEKLLGFRAKTPGETDVLPGVFARNQ